MALAFSPTTELLAAGFGFSSGIIRLGDSTSGEPRGQLTNHTGWVSALAFRPDGRLLASASVDRTIRVWNVADQTELRCLRGHQDKATALAFLPDGRTLVSGCADGSVCFWDVMATNRTPGHTSLAISYGFTAATNLNVQSFSRGALDTKAVLRLGLAFTPDSRGFLTTDPAGGLAVWDARSVRPTEALPALGGNNWNVALSPDGRRLTTGGADAKEAVKLWDIATRRELITLPAEGQFFVQLGFSPDGNTLVAIALDGMAHLWRAPSWAEIEAKEKEQKTP